MAVVGRLATVLVGVMGATGWMVMADAAAAPQSASEKKPVAPPTDASPVIKFSLPKK